VCSLHQHASEQAKQQNDASPPGAQGRAAGSSGCLSPKASWDGPRQGWGVQWDIARWGLTLSSSPGMLGALVCHSHAAAIALVNAHLCPVSKNNGMGEDEERWGGDGGDVTCPA